MAKRGRSDTRLVYTTDGGRQPTEKSSPDPAAAPSGDGIVRLHRQTKGRGGKAVTLVTGLPLAGDDLKALAKALKQKCGVGGAVKGRDVEIQGDQRETLKLELERLGYTVKIAGG